MTIGSVIRSLAAVMILLVAGCVAVTPAQRAEACSSTDWLRFGVNDGQLGVPVSARAAMFDGCAQVGQPADQKAYQQGRKQGLASYCTVETGYRVGYEGRPYYRVCPPKTEPNFLQGFEHGRRERPAVRVYPRFGVGIWGGRYWRGYPGPHTPPYWCGYWFPDCG